MRVVAVLETMWDWEARTSSAGYAEAPSWFTINPRNFTGRRLYGFVGPKAQLVVTNACRELVRGPEEHGRGDPKWLKTNLESLLKHRIETVLVCGRIAQDTFYKAGIELQDRRVVFMPHPAARNWTREALDAAAVEIQTGTGNVRLSIVNKQLQVVQL